MGDVGGALGGIGKFAVGGAAALLGATVAIGGGLLDLAKDAAPVQGITNAFKALATSAGQDSDKLIASMTKMSMGLVDDGGLMLQYNKSAQLMGTTLAGQLPDAYQYLAKVAASSGQDVGVLMDDLVNGVGRVTPKMMTQLGVTIDMDKANQDYAKSIGKNVDQLTKSDKQTAIFNATMAQLKINTASMPDITDNASTKMQQFSVKFEDMKETLGTALLPMLGGFMDLMSSLADTVLPIITPIITDIGQAFTTFFNALKEGANPLQALSQALGGTSTAGSAIGDLFQNISTWVTTVALPALQKFGAWFMQDVLPAVVGFIQGTVIPAVSEFIGTLIRIWNDVAPFLQNLANWFIQDVLPLVVHYIRDVVMVAVQDWINILVSIWNAIQPTLQQLYDWFITTGLPLIQNALDHVVKDFIKPFIDILAGIMIAVGPIFDALKDWFVTTGLPAIQNAISGVMNNFIKPLINLLTGIWDSVKGPLTSVFNWFKDTFSTVVKFIQPVIDIINDIINKVGQALNALRTLGGQTAGQNGPSTPITGDGIGVRAGIRDSGGPGRAGGAYMIGTGAQPEMFIPSTSGTFVPNADKMGGSSVNIQSLVVNANDAAGGSAAGEAFIGVLDEWQSRGNR